VEFLIPPFFYANFVNCISIYADMKLYPAILFLLISVLINAQAPVQRTYCNPMDINYHYNFEQLNQKISYRSGADPVIVNHRGEYYLFVTISGGRWHSKDLIHLDYVRFSDEGNKLEIRALNKGQDYYFAIEAFNENGVSACSAPAYCK
jgi:hypothetical protein